MNQLHIYHRLGDLPFEALMDIYVEGNLENARCFWPEAPEEELLPRAKASFRQYLQEDFFARKDAAYYLWEEGGSYVSALRLMPFEDGLLLEALETRPDQRRQGYAAALIRAVLARLGETGPVKLYSHVSKRNEASLRTHDACGFHIIADSARYEDGSLNPKQYTLVYEA